MSCVHFGHTNPTNWEGSNIEKEPIMSIRIVNILEIKITNLALSLGHWADKSMINLNITGEMTINVAPEIPQLQNLPKKLPRRFP